jgi:pimeloyl-ACP methyl ester carboxylesterase
MTANRPIIQDSGSNELPSLRYRVFLPPNADETRPLVVVHGSQRSAASMFHAMLPACMTVGRPLIAPTFSREQFRGYQSLNGESGPMSAANALLQALSHAGETFGLKAGPFDLLGFSGGGEFAHRFAMVEPASVARLIVVAAGWYTYLDDNRAFPHGVKRSPNSGDAVFDISAFLDIPTLVMVGENDIERDENLRQRPSLDRRQGPNRLTRALKWIDHLEEAAQGRRTPSKACFDVLPAVGHSFQNAVRSGGLTERVLRFVAPQRSLTLSMQANEMELP